MIKFTMTKESRKCLVIGLSFENLDKFKEQPGDTYIHVDGKEMGLPVDVVLFSGETEAKLFELVQDGIGPDTKLNISDKLKS